MTAHAPIAAGTGESGFALLVMLGLIGMGSVGILFCVQRFVPPLADVVMRTDDNLATVQSRARAAFCSNGAFPASLAALATATGLDANGTWRRDPHGFAQDLDYQIVATGLRVRSRGPDHNLGTADDITVDVATEPQLRARQRERLRLVRAVLLRSPYRYVATMTAADQATMRSAMHSYAIARRQWLTATVSERATLTTQMTAATAAIDALVTGYARPPLPAALTGAGGLMEQLAMPDLRAVDGVGNPWLGNPSVGVLAAGGDSTGGTDDDM